MVHNLSKIFVEYGDSNWSVGIAITLLMAVIGLVVCIKGLRYKVPQVAIPGITTMMVSLLIFIISCICSYADRTKNINAAIKKEYPDAYIINNDNQFISDNKIYNYEIKDKKIIITLTKETNVNIIE